MAPEVLLEHVLARTPELIVWWGRAQPRLMFFGDGHAEAKKLNGRMYPHPPIVFAIHGRELFVRALAEDRRPTADTHLKNAPYWNTDSDGRVCLGSMRVRRRRESIHCHAGKKHISPANLLIPAAQSD